MYYVSENDDMTVDAHVKESRRLAISCDLGMRRGFRYRAAESRHHLIGQR